MRKLCENPKMTEEQIKFTIETNLKKHFQRQCLERDIKMATVLRQIIKIWSDRDDLEHLEEIEDLKAAVAAIEFVKKLASGERPENSEVLELAKLLDINDKNLIKARDSMFP